jgi:hypothetical protein
MNTALGHKDNMRLSDYIRPDIYKFLSGFDAIFTLNQDLLLELHYDPSQDTQSRWQGTYFPGIEPQMMPKLGAREIIDLRRQVGTIGPRIPNLQPIFKLHGSIDWSDGTGALFVVGGGKAQYIDSKPLLKAYFTEFRNRLSVPNARLMIIGYGVADDHVNKLITDVSEATQTLSIYYVHPEGRDAVHQGKQHKALIGYSHPQIAHVPCIGESRRPLTSTFGEDDLEYERPQKRPQEQGSKEARSDSHPNQILEMKQFLLARWRRPGERSRWLLSLSTPWLGSLLCGEHVQKVLGSNRRGSRILPRYESAIHD